MPFLPDRRKWPCLHEQTEKKVPPEDTFRIRCRKVRYLINFAYSRQESGDCPCSRILDRWFTHFPVADFLRR
jgi:hypothetical protein